MDLSIGHVSQFPRFANSVDVRGADSGRLPHARDSQVAVRPTPLASVQGVHAAEESLGIVAATDVIERLLESVKRMLLSIGENFPPYLPATADPVVPSVARAGDGATENVRDRASVEPRASVTVTGGLAARFAEAEAHAMVSAPRSSAEATAALPARGASSLS